MRYAGVGGDGRSRDGHAYMFRLRPPVEVLAGEDGGVLELLLLLRSCLAAVSSQRVQSREDEGCGFGERDAVGRAHRRSHTVLGLLRDAHWRREIRLDGFVDVDANFHVGGFGIPRQHHTVEAAGAVETIVDLVEEAVVSIHTS